MRTVSYTHLDVYKRQDIILADEPTGNLDSKNAQLVFDILKSLTREKQKTVIFITHNMELAKQSDRIVQIKDGDVYKRHVLVSLH